MTTNYILIKTQTQANLDDLDLKQYFNVSLTVVVI